MTIYQGEGKGAAREIKQKEVFVQFREEARGGGALQAGLGISDKVLDHHASKELQEAKKTHPNLTPRQVIRELD